MVTSVKMPDLSTTSNKLQLSETERSAGQNAKSVDDGLRISLIIRNLADKYGVDLKSISGTGPMGRITREDVLKAKDIKISDVNIGVAMSNEYDLYIPVIRNCDTKTITEINHELKQLAEKASENRFAQEDLTGATVSVSNLGMFPIRSFIAVIPSDQISILSIGAIDASSEIPDEDYTIPMGEAVVRRTGRLIIVEEAPKRGGTGAEIAATAAEEMTGFLISPIKRIAAPNTPVPFSPVMENFYIPQFNRIINEIRSVCAF